MGVLAEPVWEDPPLQDAIRHGGVRKVLWRDAVAPLRKNPGRWARLAEYSDPAQALNAVWSLENEVYEIPDGQYEFTARGTRVYGRYVGPVRIR